MLSTYTCTCIYIPSSCIPSPSHSNNAFPWLVFYRAVYVILIRVSKWTCAKLIYSAQKHDILTLIKFNCAFYICLSVFVCISFLSLLSSLSLSLITSLYFSQLISLHPLSRSLITLHISASLDHSISLYLLLTPSPTLSLHPSLSYLCISLLLPLITSHSICSSPSFPLTPSLTIPVPLSLNSFKDLHAWTLPVSRHVHPA